MPGKELVPLAEMVQKIEAACLARRDDDFVIIARTDAIAVEGIEGTLARVRAYAGAGADMIFPDAVRDEDDIRAHRRGGRRAGDDQHGLRHPLAPDDAADPDPAPEGARRAPHQPAAHAACRGDPGDDTALALMRESIETGEPIDRPDLLVGIEDIMKLMDYEGARALERRLLSTETLAKKYGAVLPGAH